MLGKLASIVGICLLVAGCGENPSSAPPDTDTQPQDGENPATPDQPDAAIASYARDLTLTDCESVTTEARYPDGYLERPRHPTWPEWPYPEGDIVNISLLDCHRLALGSFERPVRLVVETITPDAVVPETCHPDPETRPASVRLGFVVSIGVNDSRVAEVLHSDYGLPAYAAAVEVATDETGAQVWRWSAQEGPTSELRTPIDPLPRQDGRYLDWRWYWFNDTAVSAVDLHWDFEGALWDEPIQDALVVQEAAARLSYGTLEEPMLAAGPAYVGKGEYQTKVEWTGHITMFTDHQCSAEAA